MQQWREMALATGFNIVEIDPDKCHDFKELLIALEDIGDDVIYCHAVMALHNLDIITSMMEQYDGVVMMQQGSPYVGLELLALTRDGLRTLIDYAQRRYHDDAKIPQDANIHTMILHALGQRLYIAHDDGTMITRATDARHRGVIATYCAGDDVMQRITGAKLDAYDVIANIMENVSRSAREVEYGD